jgi:hypothetical protein
MYLMRPTFACLIRDIASYSTHMVHSDQKSSAEAALCNCSTFHRFYDFHASTSTLAGSLGRKQGPYRDELRVLHFLLQIGVGIKRSVPNKVNPEPGCTSDQASHEQRPIECFCR